MKKIGRILLGWWLRFTIKNPEFWVRDRFRICTSCDSCVFGMCTECGCNVKAKAMLGDELCPLDKWPKLM